MLDELDAILSDDNDYDYAGLASAAISKLQEAEQAVAAAKQELRHLNKRIVSDLAVVIRRMQPALSVSIKSDECIIAYRTKFFKVTPNFNTGFWDVVSNNSRFGREFLQANKRSTFIDSDLSIMAKAIVDHFTAYYRTLNEELTGTGDLLVDGVVSTLVKLVAHRNG